MSITDNGEINIHIPCRGIAKVHPAPINSFVPQLDVIHEQLSRVRCSAEECAVTERGR